KGDFLGLHGFFETVREAFSYHSRECRSAFQIRRLGKSRTSLECFQIAIFFCFANGFTLSSDDDDRLLEFASTRHLQNAIVAIVLSRELDVKRVTIRKSSNGL